MAAKEVKFVLSQNQDARRRRYPANAVKVTFPQRVVTLFSKNHLAYH